MFTEFGAAFGGQVKYLRESVGATQDQLARAIARTGTGVTWTRSRVAQVEAGRGAADLPQLIAVALALGELRGEPVALADLLPESGLNYDLRVVRAALSGGPVGDVPGEVRIHNLRDPLLTPGWGTVDDTVVKRTGSPASVVLRTAQHLYAKRTGTQERDHRAGKGANPQKLGRVARDVIAELVSALEEELATDALHGKENV